MFESAVVFSMVDSDPDDADVVLASYHDELEMNSENEYITHMMSLQLAMETLQQEGHKLDPTHPVTLLHEGQDMMDWVFQMHGYLPCVECQRDLLWPGICVCRVEQPLFVPDDPCAYLFAGLDSKCAEVDTNLVFELETSTE
jgi:hypothetical protein